MDLAIPTTSTSTSTLPSKAKKPKKARRSKPLTLSKRGRKPKNTPIKVKRANEDDEVVAHDYFKIEKILRKAEFASSGGETKYLVSWPNTWEPEENLGNCPELLKQFEAGLPQIVEIDDDNTQPFSSEWVVEKILKKRYDEDGDVEYLLKWQNSWVDAKDIRGNIVKDFEDKLPFERLMALDAKNNNNNNNNSHHKNNNDDDDDSRMETMKRNRSISADEMPEMEPNAKKQASAQKKLDEPNNDSPKVIEMELITLSEQRKLDRIIDIGKSNDGSFSFMLKFETGELGIMKRQVTNIKYPQEVIEFYQRRIKFS